jgi:hypothetical protein
MTSKKKWKKNQPTKINLIGCDTIVNSAILKFLWGQSGPIEDNQIQSGPGRANWGYLGKIRTIKASRSLNSADLVP